VKCQTSADLQPAEAIAFAPISRYPLGSEMAVALDKLFAWVDKGVVPLFADLSPGSVGLYQSNVVVPNEVGKGNLNVAFNVGGTNSNPTTIPVQ